jgi:acetoin utilization protein AcuB
MRIREVMTKRVETIPSYATAGEALARMRQRRIRHLVVTEGGGIIGVLSDRDLGNLGAMVNVETVRERMSRPVVTAGPDTTVRKAANLLRGRTIGCLPVVAGAQLIGIVTTTDLLELLGRAIGRDAAKPRRWAVRRREPPRQSSTHRVALRSRVAR